VRGARRRTHRSWPQFAPGKERVSPSRYAGPVPRRDGRGGSGFEGLSDKEQRSEMRGDRARDGEERETPEGHPTGPQRRHLTGPWC
jgi:hypothetical protein